MRKRRTKLNCLILTVTAVMVAATGLAHAAVLNVQLNGLEVGIDEETGSLVRLSYPATGIILEAPAKAAGIVDLAYPTDPFPPLRLAPRFSKAKVERQGNGVRIYWEALGASRAGLALPSGKVSAEVKLAAADDGRSVILSCRIVNGSSAPVPQILFPDLWGLRPITGAERTQLRFGNAIIQPFAKPVWPADGTPFYATVGWQVYPASGYRFGDQSLRWLDWGSFRGGLSAFEKAWGTYDRPSVMTYRSEEDPSTLRLAWQHKHTIAPGETWQSQEFWLTPHAGGWAKGIEVYRAYVRQVNPPRETPRHVKEGIGFETIWMSPDGEPDPEQAAFRYKDIARVAEDAHLYGINELVIWFWTPYFRLPMLFRPELGTEQDFLRGIQEARKIGVNVAPFVSLHIMLDRLLPRYGMKPEESAGGNWTYHPELIPRFRPYYVGVDKGEWVSDTNPVWQQDVLGALAGLIQKGIASICWDQFGYVYPKEGEKPALVNMVEQLRRQARAQDPESTFSGEAGWDLEQDSPVLDYTWVWGGCGDGYVEASPLTNVLRWPRFNCNVTYSPRVAKQGFADNLYLNLLPKKPDQPNGTALISDVPALAAAMKQVAKLRQQFLPYFTEGTLIGDSVLSEPAQGFVRGYQLGNKLLVIVLNDQDKYQNVNLHSDLSLWLPASNSYKLRTFDSEGRLTGTTLGQGHDWQVTTAPLRPLDLAFFEIEAQ
jgi:hypothetical protein